MRIRQRFTYFGFILGLLLLSAAPAQAQLGGLEGEVKGTDGKPMAGVTIQIERTDIKQVFETKTDSKGMYVYAGLAAGRATYNVRAIKDGQVLYTHNSVMIPTGDMRKLSFDMKALRKEDEARMTDEQKRLIEEQRKAMEKDKSLRAEFDLGVKLLSEPSAATVCAARCRTALPEDRAACIATCQEAAGQNAQQMAYEEAAAAFERASTIDPSQYAVWANLGRAYERANNIEKSIAAFEKAIEVKPEEAAGLYANLVPLYIKMERVAEARKGCEKVAPANPQQGSACYYNIGIIMYNNNKLKEAVEPLQLATQLDPKRADAHYWLGVCRFGSATTAIEEGQVKTVLQPGTREAFEQYLTLEPSGRYAEDAKAMLAAIEQTVPTAIKVKKSRN
ncbi:MAG: tetratricopeptide repeat protein [Candidatus Acidiferrales bacterium]